MTNRLRSILVSAAIVMAGLCPAIGQQFPTPSAGIVAGTVPMCLNATGQAVACGQPVIGPGTGTTGAVVGSLPAVAGKTNLLCGFDVSAIGGTATVGPIVVAGLLGGSFTYQLASAAAGNTLGRNFTPCLPASGPNTAITVTTTADGTASAVDVNTWGYLQ